jgi:SET domain-containing protein
MRIKSYRSPKTEVRKSTVHGRGLFAKERIKRGELIAIKGGHKINRKKLNQYRDIIRDAEMQIGNDLYLAPLDIEEVEESMIFINHSCDPNVGIQSHVEYVAMRDIDEGEEIFMDYAMHRDDEYVLICNCKSRNCRNKITGKDWQIKELQKKYGNYFASYLKKRFIKNNQNSHMTSPR